VTLFSDTFEADLPLLFAPSGWSNEPPGLLGLGGYTVTTDGTHVMIGPQGSTGYPTAVAGSTSWTDYTVSADVKVNPTNGHARIVARHQSQGNFYACGLDGNQTLFMGKETGGTWSSLGSNGYSFNGTTWYHIAFAVQGTSLSCTVTEPGTGHSQTVTASATSYATGSIGATGEYGSKYDNFVVTSLP
jgi:pectate lyase